MRGFIHISTLLVVLFVTAAQSDPPSRASLGISGNAAGSVLPLLEPQQLARQIARVPADKMVSVSSGGGGGLGVRHYSWKVTVGVQNTHRKIFKERFKDEVISHLRQAGAAGEIGGGGGGGSAFDESNRYSYALKGEPGQLDVMGIVDVLFIALAGDEVAVVVTVHEAEIDVMSRAERDSRFEKDPAGLKEFSEKWAALATAKSFRAKQEKMHNKKIESDE